MPTSLRRVLGLRDVTLFAIACIVGTRWISAAAHAGPVVIPLWIMGAIFFVVPLSAAVGTLTARDPSAGGLYVWTRKDFGPWHGFLCFWSYWVQMALWFPSAAMFYIGSISGHLADSRWFLVSASLTAIWIALGTNIAGVNIGKWTQNLGGLACWLLAALLVIVAALVWLKRGSATPLHLKPEWSWSTLNLWGVVAFAMSGMELIGLMGAEIRHPERTVPRAGWIASAFVTTFYVATSIALLTLLPYADITELHGLTQAGQAAASVLGTAWFVPVIPLLLIASSLGQFGGIGTAVSRMPYAAGVDHLLPAAFGKLHPRWATPHIAMLTLGGASSALLLATQLGDTVNAAYQSLVSLMVIAGFSPYIYLFGSAWKAGRRVCAISGWAVTAIAILCSAIPGNEIHAVFAFELKLAVGTVATVGSAWLIYSRRRNITTH